MTDPQLENLIENEKEWRRYIVSKLETIEKEMSSQKAWSLVYRLSGAGVLSLLYIWIESKFK